MRTAASVREIPASDLPEGARLEWGGSWQPPVFQVTTWGPGRCEAPSHPEIWWTRVSVRQVDGALSDHFYEPSFPARVVQEVPCRGCGALTPAVGVTMGRRTDHGVLIELFDLCPACADIDENGA